MQLIQKHPPITKQQAQAICHEHQHFVGASFDPNIPGKGYITCITAAPYDTARQWQFAQFYLDCNDAVKALRFYKGEYFVPLVMSIPVIRKRSIVFQDLRAYLHANNMPMHIVRFAHEYK
jgi:hypothetical protein